MADFLSRRTRRPAERARGARALTAAIALMSGLIAAASEARTLISEASSSPFAHLYDREALHAPGSRSFQALRTDDGVLDLIKSREKLRLRAFRGASGLWLIGYGHAATARPGRIITEQEAERLLRLDLIRFEEAVKARLTRPVRQREFSAMVDLAYNAGIGAFAGSSVLRRFNAGDRLGAADAFLAWNKYRRRGRLVVSRELTIRRRLARAHFLGRS